MAPRRIDLTRQLRDLGIASGNVVMVHASLRALGEVHGGPREVAEALRAAVGPSGTLMAFVSWDRSSYDATLNGRDLSPADREAWPAFDPPTARPYPGFGALNIFLADLPGSYRSAHPDACIWACGPAAPGLVSPHHLGTGFGPGSPIERFLALDGKVLLLGAPPDAVTVLHYAEAVADIPNKRRVRYCVPVRDEAGSKVWRDVEEFDTNGILDCYARECAMDAVETIARAYLTLDRHASGRVGEAESLVFEAADIVRYGVQWLERHHGGSSAAAK
jgi:aminoglycoside N3'-acetyltransferase